MTSFVLLEALMSKDSEAIRQARVRQLLAQMKIKLGDCHGRCGALVYGRTGGGSAGTVP
jgi:hypothetical protein